MPMARDCCWNCRHYIVKGDNEPPLLGGAISNVCVYSRDGTTTPKNWVEKAWATPAGYVCTHYEERFY